MKPLLWGILFTSLLLVGCRIAPVTPAPTPTFSPVPASTPLLSANTSATATLAPSATLTATSTVTPTKTVSPTATPTLFPTEIAIPSPSAPYTYTIPPPPTITPTSTFTDNQGGLTHLLELPSEGTDFQLSPNAQWLTYLVITPLARAGGQLAHLGPGAGPHPATLYLLNIATGKSRQVTSDCTNFLCEFAWLSTGEFLWREGGNLYLSNPTGQNVRDLTAPNTIIEILGVTPNDTVVVRGESSLWRLYLPAGTWDAVSAPLPGPAPSVEYGYQNNRLYVTEDGTTATVVYDTPSGEYLADTTILHLPLTPGAVPITIIPPTLLVPPDYGGMPFTPPAPLAESHYWLPAKSPFQNGSEPKITSLIDERTGTLVPIAFLINSPPDYFWSDISLSTDRHWLAVTAAPEPSSCPPNSECPGSYVLLAPTNALTKGTLVNGYVIGWQHDPPAVYMDAGSMGTYRFVRYNLLEGIETLHFDRDYPSGFQTTSSERMTILSFYDAESGFLHAYAPDGTLVAHTLTEEQYSILLSINRNRLYFINHDFFNHRVTLWQWDVTP